MPSSRRDHACMMIEEISGEVKWKSKSERDEKGKEGLWSNSTSFSYNF